MCNLIKIIDETFFRSINDNLAHQFIIIKAYKTKSKAGYLIKQALSGPNDQRDHISNEESETRTCGVPKWEGHFEEISGEGLSEILVGLLLHQKHCKVD